MSMATTGQLQGLGAWSTLRGHREGCASGVALPTAATPSNYRRRAQGVVVPVLAGTWAPASAAKAAKAASSCGLAYEELCTQTSNATPTVAESVNETPIAGPVSEMKQTVLDAMSRLQLQDLSANSFSEKLANATPESKERLTKALSAVKEADPSVLQQRAVDLGQSLKATDFQQLFDETKTFDLQKLVSENAIQEDVESLIKEVAELVGSNVPYAIAFAVAMVLLYICTEEREAVLRRNDKVKTEQEAEAKEMAKKRAELDRAAKDREKKQRAQEVRMRERARLKAEVLKGVELLGKDALMPGEGPERTVLAQLVGRLETLSPTNLKDDHDLLKGEWELVYAAQGTNVTRLPMPPPGGPTAVSVDVHSQQLESQEGQLIGQNTAEVRVGPFGVWKISAKGGWTAKEDGSSDTSFQNLTIVPTELFGMPVPVPLPAFSVPLPQQLQDQGSWRTTYLDEELRIGRQEPSGNIFVFRLSSKSAKETTLKMAPALQLPSSSQGTTLTWTKDAKNELNKAPFFVKEAAKTKAEDYARQIGATEVTMDIVEASR